MQEQAGVVLDFPEDRIFRYQAMQDILHQLVNNPFEQFTQQELATITGADVSTISRSIDLLEQLGVLVVMEGKPRHISMSQDHLQRSDSLFAVPQAEFREPIQAFLNELQTCVETGEHMADLVGVVLFGSVARGTADRPARHHRWGWNVRSASRLEGRPSDRGTLICGRSIRIRGSA